MSRFQAKKRTAAAIRKQRERAKLRSSGRIKVEPWITAKTKGLMTEFGRRIGMEVKGVSELILEAATPLYLAEIGRRLDALVPLVERIREFEYYGIRPTPGAAEPVRINGASGPVILDPREYQNLLEKVTPLVAQLQRYGISKSALSKLVPVKKRPLPTLRPSL